MIPARLERATDSLEGYCSIQLSYGTYAICEAKLTDLFGFSKRIRNPTFRPIFTVLKELPENENRPSCMQIACIDWFRAFFHSHNWLYIIYIWWHYGSMTNSLISCWSRDRRSVQYCVRPVCIALRRKINRRWKRFQVCYEKQSRGILQVDFKKNHPLDLLYADRRMGAEPLSSGLQAPPEYASSMAYDRREGVSVGTACPPGGGAAAFPFRTLSYFFRFRIICKLFYS